MDYKAILALFFVGLIVVSWMLFHPDSYDEAVSKATSTITQVRTAYDQPPSKGASAIKPEEAPSSFTQQSERQERVAKQANTQTTEVISTTPQVTNDVPVEKAIRGYYDALSIGHAAKAWEMSGEYVRREVGINYNQFKEFHTRGNGRNLKLSNLNVLSETDSEAKVEVTIYYSMTQEHKVYTYILKKGNTQQKDFGGWFFYQKSLKLETIGLDKSMPEITV